MIILQKAKFRMDGGWQCAKGTWSPGVGVMPFVTCPDCGGHALLYHDIDFNGVVTPSVGCPFDKESGEPCGFHDYMVLEGWKPLL